MCWGMMVCADAGVAPAVASGKHRIACSGHFAHKYIFKSTLPCARRPGDLSLESGKLEQLGRRHRRGGLILYFRLSDDGMRPDAI